METEKVKELKSKLAICFDRLQRLDIKPTVTNMENLLQTIYDIRDVYNEIGGEKDGGCKTDPE